MQMPRNKVMMEFGIVITDAGKRKDPAIFLFEPALPDRLNIRPRPMFRAKKLAVVAQAQNLVPVRIPAAKVASPACKCRTCGCQFAELYGECKEIGRASCRERKQKT